MDCVKEEIQEINDIDLIVDMSSNPIQLAYDFPTYNGTFDLGGNFINLTGNSIPVCVSCGIELEEPTDKYIYEVQHLKNKRCVRPLSTSYFMFEEHTRYAHEDIGEGTGKVLVIRVRSDDEKYFSALANSYFEESGRTPQEDMEAFTEWRQTF
jgi:hypothetical protein